MPLLLLLPASLAFPWVASYSPGTMSRTKVDEQLEAAAEAHADDPERVEILHRTRRFKSSWIELAEALTDARKNGQWKRWGYSSFEDYTKLELHLRQDTVDKLTGSFLFLKKRAPQVLERDGLDSRIPTYQAIDFLRRAEEAKDNGAPRDVVDEIRRRVIDDAAPFSAVSREYRDVIFPRDEPERKARDAQGLRSTAKRLHELLASTDAVPKRLAHDVAEALGRLLDALASDENAAALKLHEFA